MRNRPPFDPSLPGLPDILELDLKLVFVGYNPSLPASRAGHYYAGGQNYFYRMLHLSGLTSRLLSYEEDATLLRYGIGLTDLCKTPSAQVADLPAGRLAAGRDALREKLERYQPQTVCFNGLGVYRAFFGHPPVGYGQQKERLGFTRVFVVPSTSPANNALLVEREAAFHALARAVRSLA